MSILVGIKSRLTSSVSTVRNLTTKSTKEIQVNLPQGKIIGQEIHFDNDRKYYKFFGIPYAKPPIGKLRFRNPEPLTEFSKQPLNCTKEGSQSLQLNKHTGEIKGSEDCLFLNVHTTRMHSSTNLPVIVWIHGGLFNRGNGNFHIDYPRYLLDQDVILVTLNYRLGPMGFLCVPNGGISGNFGLKDQQMALKWVRENIHEFCGDPRNITLMGQSVGSVSAHLHLLSEESQKYFDKLICQSGTSLVEWAMETCVEEKSNKMAKLLGYEGEPGSIEMGNFLRNYQDPNGFINNTYEIYNKNENLHPVLIPFGPVIESADSENPFLTERPVELMKKSNLINKIPVLMGYNSMEGILFLLTPSFHSVKDIIKNLSCLVPIDRKFNDENRVVESIRKSKLYSYLFSDNRQIDLIAHIITDISFKYGIYKTIELHARYQTQSPLYCYKFCYDGNLNGYKKLINYNIVGANHGDELCYLFYPSRFTKDLEIDENDVNMVKNMCKMWTNFAKTGDPTSGQIEGGFNWNKAVQRDADGNIDFEFLRIDKDLKMVKNPDIEVAQFWKNLVGSRL